MLAILKNWKLLGAGVGVIGIILAISILSVKVSNLRSNITKLESAAREDSLTILNLERENIGLIADTTKYRSEIRGFKVDLDKLKLLDKKLGKDLSAKYPTIDQIKQNPQ